MKADLANREPRMLAAWEREGLYHLITDMGAEPGVLRIRIINREGRISFSSDPREANTFVDKRAEACYACHSQAQPLTHLNRSDRFRTYRVADGTQHRQVRLGVRVGIGSGQVDVLALGQIAHREHLALAVVERAGRPPRVAPVDDLRA